MLLSNIFESQELANSYILIPFNEHTIANLCTLVSLCS